MKNLVYTYCNYDTFFLISKGSFKLADLRKCNDAMELKERCSKDIMVLRDLYNSAVNVDNSHIEKYAHLNWLAYVIEKTATESNALGCCFSELRDNKGMWYEYGGHGKGVSIGFDVEKIKLLANEEGLEFGQVKYLPKCPEIFIGDIMQISRDKTGDKAYNYFRDNILTKNRNFKDEKEWRLFKMIIDIEPNEKLQPLYLTFNPEIIKDIVIGSDCTEEERETIISSFKHNLNISISNVPCKKSENRTEL